jgi:hypothetical protein
MRGLCPHHRAARAVAAVAAAVLLPLTAVSVAHSAPPTAPPPADPTPTEPTEPTEPTPDKPTAKPKKKPDRKAPGVPSVGSPIAGADGRLTVTVSTERGAQVVVREGATTVAAGRATGGSVTLSWTTTTGEHTYTARATDKAGNRSRPATFSAEADADPPPLSRATWTAGTPEDTRSAVRFRTAAGTAYRVLVDGSLVADGTAEDPAVRRVVDLANGDHDVRVEVVDGVGNVAARERGFTVRIPSLNIGTEVTSRPTTRRQVVRVTATPNATTGEVRVPGAEPREFALRGGRATVRLSLPDDIYTGVAVVVRDAQGRRGTTTLDPFEVDTTPPILSLDTDSRAAAGGRLEATVRTEPGARISWTLADASGVAVDSGSFTADERTVTISTDVDAGSYDLEVVATDEHDRSVTRTSALSIATDPTPIWLILLAGLGVAVGGVALLFALPLLLQRLGRAVGRRRERHRLVVADAARREHLAEREAVHEAWQGRASVVSDFLHGVAVGWDVGDLPGLTLRPGETVRHMTVATAYEAVGHGPAENVTTAAGALVVTGQRLVLLGDEPHEWPVEDVRDLVHVGDDESVLHHAGADERWTVLSYGEVDTTRLHLDHLRAELQGRGAEHLEERRAELSDPTREQDAVDLSAWV